MLEITPFPGISFNVDLIDLFERLYGYLEKDKRAICIVLHLIDWNTNLWFKEINEIFSELKMRNLTDEPKDSEIRRNLALQLEIFADREEREPFTEKSIEFLESVIQKYNKGKLRSLINSIEPDKLKTIVLELDEFRTQARGTKKNWQIVAENDDGSYVSVDPAEIRKFKDDMSEHLKAVARTVNDIQKNMECKNGLEQSFKKILEA